MVGSRHASPWGVGTNSRLRDVMADFSPVINAWLDCPTLAPLPTAVAPPSSSQQKSEFEPGRAGLEGEEEGVVGVEEEGEEAKEVDGVVDEQDVKVFHILSHEC